MRVEQASVVHAQGEVVRLAKLPCMSMSRPLTLAG